MGEKRSKNESEEGEILKEGKNGKGSQKKESKQEEKQIGRGKKRGRKGEIVGMKKEKGRNSK